jgi:hypothetical protein
MEEDGGGETSHPKPGTLRGKIYPEVKPTPQVLIPTLTPTPCTLHLTPESLFPKPRAQRKFEEAKAMLKREGISGVRSPGSSKEGSPPGPGAGAGGGGSAAAAAAAAAAAGSIKLFFGGDEPQKLPLQWDQPLSGKLDPIAR